MRIAVAATASTCSPRATTTAVDASTSSYATGKAATIPHVAIAASLHVVQMLTPMAGGGPTTAVAAQAPAAQAVEATLAVRQPMPKAYEATAKACVHVAVDQRVVAAVRHGQPVADEPYVGHGLPVAVRLRVVQEELRDGVRAKFVFNKMDLSRGGRRT